MCIEKSGETAMKPYTVINVFTLVFFLTFGIIFNHICAAEFSQNIEIPSSPNPVGSGARALGMGGSFIAIADDATAASWNPGGLIQLENPETSLVGTYCHRIEDNMYGVDPDSGGNESVSNDNLNYLSVTYPFMLWKRNMVVSLNYQHLYDFTREWSFSMNLNAFDLSRDEQIYYQQEGRLSAIGFSYCIQIIPDFSLGMTFNVWDDKFTRNHWEQRTYQLVSGIDSEERFKSGAQNIHQYSFQGYNMNFGFLWSITENFTIGAVIKTPFKADLKHKNVYYVYIEYPKQPKFNIDDADTSETDETLRMPISYGLGFAYKFSDNLTISLDIYRTEWDDFIRTDQGINISPITGKEESQSNIKPTQQIRTGAEYRFITSKYLISLSGGVFYDPVPAEGNPDDFYGFSVGSGIKMRRWDWLNFNCAYQYRYGNDVGDSILKDLQFSQDVEEHAVYTSFIIYFY